MQSTIFLVEFAKIMELNKFTISMLSFGAVGVPVQKLTIANAAWVGL